MRVTISDEQVAANFELFCAKNNISATRRAKLVSLLIARFMAEAKAMDVMDEAANSKWKTEDHKVVVGTL